MRVISRRALREFWERHPTAEPPLRDWLRVVEQASWRRPADVRDTFRHADFVGDRVVFNVGGNNYRIVAFVAFNRGAVYIRFVGTHASYNRVDVRTV